jgi:hypothetical protein
MNREQLPPAHDEPSGTLYHYTDAYGLQGILRSKQVWATEFRHMNDRNELREGEEIAVRLLLT